MRMPKIPLMALLLSMLFLLASTTPLKAERESQQLVGDANSAFRAGEYGKAVKLYQEALEESLDNPALHYNLANAHFQRGSYAKALAHYRSALRLQPRDADIKANYLNARQKLGKPPRAQRSMLSLRSLREALGLRELQFLFVLSYAAVFLILLCWPEHRLRAIPPASIAVLAAFMLFCIEEQPDASLAYRLPFISESRAVAIVVDSVSARAGSAEHFAAVLQLEPGTELWALQSRDTWIQVRVPGGRTAWVPKSALYIFDT